MLLYHLLKQIRLQIRLYISNIAELHVGEDQVQLCQHECREYTKNSWCSVEVQKWHCWHFPTSDYIFAINLFGNELGK